jgi:hypothetical protein
MQPLFIQTERESEPLNQKKSPCAGIIVFFIKSFQKFCIFLDAFLIT